MHNRAQIRDTVSFIACPTAGGGVSRASKQQCSGAFLLCPSPLHKYVAAIVRGPLLSHDLALSNWQRARTQHMNPETAPEQDKPEPFALDLNDETPLPVICELSEDGTCEACQ